MFAPAAPVWPGRLFGADGGPVEAMGPFPDGLPGRLPSGWVDFDEWNKNG